MVDPLAENYYEHSPYNYTLNNPILFIDPNGEDVWTYDLDGNLVSYQEDDEVHEIYYQQQNEDGETEDVLLGSGEEFTTEFHTYVGTVYAESSGDQTESAAIADVINNRAESSDQSITEVIQNTGIYGYESDAYDSYQDNRNENGNSNQRNAVSGVIDVYTGGEDQSQGAYFWEGYTFINPESRNFNENNWFVRSGYSYNTNLVGTNGQINYLSTPARRIGGTVFFRNNPRIHGNRQYP